MPSFQKEEYPNFPRQTTKRSSPCGNCRKMSKCFGGNALRSQLLLEVANRNGRTCVKRRTAFGRHPPGPKAPCLPCGDPVVCTGGLRPRAALGARGLPPWRASTKSARREPAGACRLQGRRTGIRRMPPRTGTPFARRRRAIGSPFKNRTWMVLWERERLLPSPVCLAPFACAESLRGELVGS